MFLNSHMLDCEDGKRPIRTDDDVARVRLSLSAFTLQELSPHRSCSFSPPQSASQ